MIYISPYPAIELPSSAMHEYVLHDALARGEHPALVDGVNGEAISYALLHQLVERVAAGLASAGLSKGDVVAIYAPDTIFYPVACLAASRVGATFTPVSPLYTAREMVGQLRDAGASYLVTVSALAAWAASELPGTVREVFLFDRQEFGPRCLLDIVETDATAPLANIDARQDVAVLAYSSGTPGTAKVVMLTHRNITANIAQMAHALEVTTAHRIMAMQPFSHEYGFSMLMGLALRAGGTIVVLPRFDLAQFLDTITRHRITHALVAPPIVVALARHPTVDDYDLSSLQQVLSYGTSLRPEIAELAHRRLGMPVTQAYGMTELSPSALVPSANGTPPGSVGKPLPHTVCRLVSPADGKDVGPDEVGELWVHGPQVMKGYLGRPDATNAIVDADGWLHTGDIARTDADGWFYVFDRVRVDEFLTDVRILREQARANIERGPVTAAYGADLDRVLAVLNDALATEIVCVLRSRQHHFAATGLKAEPVAAEFLAHAAEEQTHAYAIAARIVQLGGPPGLDRAAQTGRARSQYRASCDLLEMVTENLVAKLVAIESYTEIIAWLGIADPTTRRMLGMILANQEEQARDMLTFLQKMS